MLIIDPNITHQSLISRGVPKRTLGLFKAIDPVASCSQFLRIGYDDDGSELKKPVQPRKQMEWLNRITDSPYHGSYCAYFSDYHNGDLARNAAASIFSIAMAQFEVAVNRERPRWIRLHQGFDTQVPLYGPDRPSLLVIDNVFTDSTPTKVEKLRDILSSYDDVPVIVIVSTPGSPLSMCEAFNLPRDYGILLRDTRLKTKEESI